MTTLTFLADRDYRDFGGLVSVSTHGARDFVYRSAEGYSITITGTGLTYNSQNRLTGGTITSLSVSDGATAVLTWTDMNFAASQYARLAFGSAPDLVALSSAMRAGADAIYAGPFDSTISGGAGNDVLVGRVGDDWLFGDSGVDTYDGGAGIDGVSFFSLDAGGHGVQIDLTRPSVQIRDDGYGNVEHAIQVENWEGSNFGDTILGGTAAERMWGLSGKDSLRGGGGSDWVVGNAGNDTLYGDAGDDALFGDSGRDSYFGGDGRDALIFQSDDAGLHGVTVDLSRTAGQVRDDGYGNVETIKSVEILILTRLNDRFTGSKLDDFVFGNYGNDTLNGMNGSDALTGNAGNDVLTGGQGVDGFVFDDNLSEAGVDHITDMRVGTDEIAINIEWAAGLTLGDITSGQFRAGSGVTQAATAAQRVIYDTKTGALYFDVDGVGGAASVKFAILDNLAAITFADIVIVENF